jgi:beta-galactosidase
VILQSGFGGQGKLTLRATSEGLTPAEVTIEVTPAPARPAVPVAYPAFVIGDWRMSPISNEHPDPNQKIADTDMNSWANIQPGHGLPAFKNGRFAIYRAQFTPRSSVQKSGGALKLRDVTGNAEVWIDGKLAAGKNEAGKKDITVPLPPGDGVRTVSVLIEAPTTGAQAGLGGTVTVE